ncbi:MAG: ribosome biosynthesis protein rrb1 [Cirrosporium novae-zelandiae]|nr:MAG: ribosome biosynthesis protein rrb1 [Cirrosporium novae-zelandiae]
MAKRAADESEELVGALKGGDRPENTPPPNEAEDFEDEFEDEFESDSDVVEAGVDGRPDEEREAEEQRDAMDMDEQVFMPGRTKLAPGETLSPDPSTYEMLHTFTTTWPCLSFDIVPDQLGNERKTFPATVYAVAGTQAAMGKENENSLMVMKLSGLSRMDHEEEESDDDDDEYDEEPGLDAKNIPLPSTANRVRVHQLPPKDSSKPPMTLTATMTESSDIFIHDITPQLTSFDNPGTIITPKQQKALHTIRSHRSEGYALDWSPLSPIGKLLTGDNDGKIFITTRKEGGTFSTDNKPFTGHSSSVEDLQWSPNERNVFSSCSSDGTVKIWDARSNSRKCQVDVQVSNTDVNVLSWSNKTAHLLATGADDGQWAVWDLRQWKPSSAGSRSPTPSPVASFDFHKEQITSIEWNPNDDSIIAVAAGDNTLTLWDLAVEFDDEESKDTAGVQDVPPQLLFVHYMEMVKECHWHRQIPGTVMGTGGGGFG